jgi:hypothetical protein
MRTDPAKGPPLTGFLKRQDPFASGLREADQDELLFVEEIVLATFIYDADKIVFRRSSVW